MTSKIIVFLTAVIVCLLLVVGYKEWRINSLESQKNELKGEICKRDDIIAQKESYIKEMEKINEAYKQAEKESQEFREKLLVDNTDNLDVVPADYILDRLRAD